MAIITIEEKLSLATAYVCSIEATHGQQLRKRMNI
jgi:hypothetical protein